MAHTRARSSPPELPNDSAHRPGGAVGSVLGWRGTGAPRAWARSVDKDMEAAWVSESATTTNADVECVLIDVIAGCWVPVRPHTQPHTEANKPCVGGAVATASPRTHARTLGGNDGNRLLVECVQLHVYR